MVLSFRPADQKDIPQLVALLQQLCAIETDFQFSAERQQRGLDLLLSTDSAVIMVACINDCIVGMVTGQLVISTAEGNPSALIEDLIVTTENRGCGIGGQLLKEIGGWAAGYGASRLQLLADRDNRRGLVFYGSGGWQQTRLICLRKYHSSLT
ncbi:GNAT family N-acetyltransferase [Desulfopila inferna]|uniref:GNAT family N-acetyltransferase n=1 Tax=Desulfopila inferna TaxID=468528 RepID=UPI0019642131|nr:GNAT family N-acetyltransferase [Desulfopila inferna]MBM9606646.1 GNAT family N-acetyltransferase [Desulfopila inferna]